MLHPGKQRENATLESLQNDSLSLWKWVSVFATENSNAGRKMSPEKVQVQIHSDEWGWNHEEHRVCGPRTGNLCPQELLKAAWLCLPSAQLRPWQNTSSHICKSWFNHGHTPKLAQPPESSWSRVIQVHDASVHICLQSPAGQ